MSGKHLSRTVLSSVCTMAHHQTCIDTIFLCLLIEEFMTILLQEQDGLSVCLQLFISRNLHRYFKILQDYLIVHMHFHHIFA